MDPVRWVLITVGAAQLALAVGFVARAPWATALWPLPDTPLSYSFIGAILAGGAGPLILAGSPVR